MLHPPHLIYKRKAACYTNYLSKTQLRFLKNLPLMSKGNKLPLLFSFSDEYWNQSEKEVLTVWKSRHTPQGNCRQFSASLYVPLTTSLKGQGFAGYLEEIPEQLTFINKTSGIQLFVAFSNILLRTKPFQELQH